MPRNKDDLLAHFGRFLANITIGIGVLVIIGLAFVASTTGVKIVFGIDDIMLVGMVLLLACAVLLLVHLIVSLAWDLSR